MVSCLSIMVAVQLVTYPVSLSPRFCPPIQIRANREDSEKRNETCGTLVRKRGWN